MYFQGDRVVYQGSRYPELKNKVGEVVAQVKGSPTKVVVDFADDSYVMDQSRLSPFKPSKESGAKELEVLVRRKYRDEEE